MLHVDVKKFGNIPGGDGWRFVGRAQGRKNRAATPGKPKNKHRNPKMGHAYVHTVIDDHSRVAYAEFHDDETAATAAAVLRRAVAWFTARGITTHRVLSHNGSAYVSHLWREVCAELEIQHSRTEPAVRRPTAKSSASTAPWPRGGDTPAATARRPSDAKLCQHGSTSTTTTAPHTACGNKPPITRLINLSGQYS